MMDGSNGPRAFQCFLSAEPATHLPARPLSAARTMPPAARASRPGPGRSGMPAADLGLPAAHRRQPDRARPVQVVRPVWRSTWTGRTRPGRDEPARREALTGSPQLDYQVGRKLGDDLAVGRLQHVARPTSTTRGGEHKSDPRDAKVIADQIRLRGDWLAPAGSGAHARRWTDVEREGAGVSRSQEIRAAGRLVGAGFVEVVDTVRDVHRAVADRWFGVLGPAALPVRVLHDGITSGVYRVVRAGHAAIPTAAGAVVARAAVGDERPLCANPPAGLALAVLNGVWGDTLRRRYPELALAMTVRADGADVPLTPRGFARAYPAATARIAVFVHGLCETEQYWSLSSQRHHGSEHSTHGSRLHHDLGYTPVYLRYNTGLHISENGEQLARLLDDVVAGWPVPVAEVVLIGHSMGGLVVRSACHHGAAAGRGWTRLVRHVFCLGTPHLGALLEKGANVGAWLLARPAETRPLSRLANLRSAGIKDLRFGSVVEEDWRDVDPDEFLRDRCTDVAFLPHAVYHFIATTVTTERDHPFGRVVGDLFVRLPSASGQGRRRRIPFELGHGRHVGGLHHFDLLNHPAVYRQIHTWLARADVSAGKRPSR